MSDHRGTTGEEAWTCALDTTWEQSILRCTCRSLVRSSKIKRWMLVMVGNVTKFLHLYPVRDPSARNLLRYKRNFITKFQLPECIIFHHCSCSTSQGLLSRNGVVHKMNLAHHLTANSLVERVNRALVPCIMATIRHSQGLGSEHQGGREPPKHYI